MLSVKNYKTGRIHKLVAIICCLAVLISCSSANTEQDTSSDDSKSPTIYDNSESIGKPTIVAPTKAITTDISTPDNVGPTGIVEYEKDISKAPITCLLYKSPSPRDATLYRKQTSA